ncbi:mitochondrial carrier [Bimuria novae-zelandiae CBS 107.79]|uniref:Mitochondrial carrier n=1 Tax=Bimuria novae-zelandiae CBS 107.79 TaxID=1447943 RepID=A0A6A5VFX0_9PLEO|nr:mitochondrial carrier [Bimuria novae-zelandiae CBS 107.79]
MAEVETSATLDHSQGTEALKDVVCGSAAGIVGKYFEYPFDTIKVRLQSQPNHLPLKYTGPWDCFKKSLKQDGFLGIYRGISAPLVGAAVETSCLFFSYRLLGDALRTSGYYPGLRGHSEKELPFGGLLACGMGAGAFTSLFLTPIELVKCKMQVPLEAPNGAMASPRIRNVIADIYVHQGLKGYWNGQLGTLIRETGGGAAWFGGYEATKMGFKNLYGTVNDDDLPVWQRMLSGSMAGMLYNFTFYPADTVKSRMQTEDVKQLTGRKPTFSAVFAAHWKQHGLRGMYRGCGITCARSIPSSAFIFTVYEELKKRWPANARASRKSLESIILNPQYHDVLALVKGIRNGIVYGTKVRFPHALVMIFLFRSGSLRSKCWLVFKATRQHARNLGFFALTYKATMLFLKHTSPEGKERRYDAFLAGLLGGYTVFGRTIGNSVSQQIVIYVFARVALALAKLAVQPRTPGSGGVGWGVLEERSKLRNALVKNGWVGFASLSWAMVMYVWRWHPEAVQPSLRSSMNYIYGQSDDWDSLRTFIWHNK